MQQKLESLKQQCTNRIETCYQIAETAFNRKFTRPTVTFSNRLTVTAGMAYTGKNEIRLSTKLLLFNENVFISDTPGHEAAHLIAYAVYGPDIASHGKEWKQVMTIIGQNPNRLHSMKSDDFFEYEVDGVKKHLSKIRHNKLQRGRVHSYSFKDGITVTKENYNAK